MGLPVVPRSNNQEEATWSFLLTSKLSRRPLVDRPSNLTNNIKIMSNQKTTPNGKRSAPAPCSTCLIKPETQVVGIGADEYDEIECHSCRRAIRQKRGDLPTAKKLWEMMNAPAPTCTDFWAGSDKCWEWFKENTKVEENVCRAIWRDGWLARGNSWSNAKALLPIP